MLSALTQLPEACKAYLACPALKPCLQPSRSLPRAGIWVALVEYARAFGHSRMQPLKTGELETDMFAKELATQTIFFADARSSGFRLVHLGNVSASTLAWGLVSAHNTAVSVDLDRRGDQSSLCTLPPPPPLVNLSQKFRCHSVLLR